MIMDYIDNPNLYDLGLFSDYTQAVEWLRLKDDRFDEMCSKSDILAALQQVDNKFDGVNEEISHLLKAWLEGLGSEAKSSNYTSVTISLPNKTLYAKKYTGSSTPSTHPLISNYPGASLLSGSSYRYNCHAYAWYYRGSVSGVATSDLLWFDSPTKFYSSPSCYQRVYTPQAGDIAVYWGCTCLQNRITHSAYITSVSAGTTHDKVQVKSKWGEYGTYSHKLSNCPYYQSSTDTHPSNSTCNGGEIRYYRLSSHDYDYISISALKHKHCCTKCGYITSTQNHTFVSMGTYSVCSYCGYTVDTPVNGMIHEEH